MAQSTTNETGLYTGGHIIARTLVQNGITRGFCVPGESYLGILDALDELGDAFDLVVSRHEGSASFMAEAYARLTGRPGLCLVTRGPGACNAMIGVSTAFQESTPMILIVGYLSTGTVGKFPFQDIDLKSTFGSMTKWVGVVERASDIPHMINRGIQIAMSGRPGPVVLAFPDNLQTSEMDFSGPVRNSLPVHAPPQSAVAEIGELLRQSERPLVIVGGNGWTQAAFSDLEIFAERFDLPVATTFRRNDLIDNASVHYVGSFGPVPHPNLLEYMRHSDLVLLLGGRLGEIETAGYRDLVGQDTSRTFVHAAPLADEFGEVLTPDLAISTEVEPLVAGLAGLVSPNDLRWSKKRADLRQSYSVYREPVEFDGLDNPAHAIVSLQDALPRDAVISVGAGNYSHFLLRHYVFRTAGTLLASLSAPMGYSVPAAIAAALANPAREAVALAGDGCFFMNPQDLVIAAKRGLPVCVLLFNNGIYGSIRMHQELSGRSRNVATTLDNPDFQALAASLGLETVQIHDPKVAGRVYTELRQRTKGPIFIELMSDPEVITTQRTLTQIREAARA